MSLSFVIREMAKGCLTWPRYRLAIFLYTLTTGATVTSLRLRLQIIVIVWRNGLEFVLCESINAAAAPCIDPIFFSPIVAAPREKTRRSS